MRKTTIAFGVMSLVLLGVILSLGSSGAQAQGDLTPTINISGLLGRPPAGGSDVTPQPTQAGQTDAQSDANAAPLVWVRVDTGFDPMVFNDVTVGGPVDTYAMVGDPCAQNTFSAQLPTFEFHLLSDSDSIRIGFVADDGSATALVMWDPMEELWWCTVDAGYGTELSFAPLVAGDYPVYVAVQGRQTKVSGQLYITEELAE